MDTRVKKKTSLLAAIVAFVALAVIGSVCFASSAFAVSKGKECSATAEITATFDESGTITVPSTELKNETDYVVTLKSATIASDLKFVADWTNDGANKTIQPGETLTINWTAPSKVSSDWNETGKVHVGTITYHFSYELGSGYITVDNKKVEEAQVGKTLDANIEGIPDSIDRNKLHYKWIAIDENGNKTVVSEGTGKDYAKYVPKDEDAGKTITFEVTDTSGTYEGTIHSENAVKIYLGKGYITVDNKKVEEAQVGKTLDANIEGIPDSIDRNKLHYKWIAIDENGNKTVVSEGTGKDYAKYVPKDEDAGKTITFEVTDTSGTYEGTIHSENAVKIYLGKGYITVDNKKVEEAQVGKTLDANIEGIPDSIDRNKLHYKWIAIDTDGNEETVFEGTGNDYASYVTTDDDVNKFITFVVTDENGIYEGPIPSENKVEVLEMIVFAVYSDDDNSLNFYRRLKSEMPTDGDQFLGKTATNVYTGIETDVYTTYYDSTWGLLRPNNPWKAHKAEITNSTIVDEKIKPISTGYWFGDLYNLTSIKDLNKLDTSNTQYMHGMFVGCSNLASFDVSSMDVSKVIYMNQMFETCTSITSLDLSKWNTESAVYMNEMFDSCSKLESLNLSNFNTANVTDMHEMFSCCWVLQSLDLSSFDTSRVTDMRRMFDHDSKLESINVTSFDTSKVTNMIGMFNLCYRLKELDLSSFDTSAINPNARDGGGTNYYGGMCNVLYGNWDLEKLTLGEGWKWIGPNGVDNADSYKGYPSSTDSDHIKGADGYWYTVDGLTPYNTVPGAEDPNPYIPDGAGTYYAAKVLVKGSTLKGNVKLEGTGEYNTKLTATVSDCPAAAILQYQWYRGEGDSKTAIQGANANEYTITDDDSGQKITVEVTASNYTGDPLTADKDITNFHLSGKIVFCDSEGNKLTQAEPGEMLFYHAEGYQSDASPDKIKLYLDNSDKPFDVGYFTFNSMLDTRGKEASYSGKILKVEMTSSNYRGSITGTIPFRDLSETGIVFAVYSADDKSLNFYKRSSVPTEGEIFEGKTATKVMLGSTFMDGFIDSSDKKFFDLCNPASVTVVDEGIQPKSTRNWFRYCEDLTNADLSKLDTSKITDMYCMFNNCRSLVSLDLSNWNTSAVTDMRYMFATDIYSDETEALTSLNLSGWKTSAVTNMCGMFKGCYKLSSIEGISNWDTSAVTDMQNMFGNCRSLVSLDLSKWNVSKVTNMSSMFSAGSYTQTPSALTSVGDLSNWNTSAVTNMSGMFYGCSSLTSLDLSGWKTSAVTNMNLMFEDCEALISVGDLSRWNTSAVTNMSRMFYHCKALTSLDLSSWNNSNVTDMSWMFKGTSHLEQITFGDNWKWVGAEGYLEAPSSGIISGADNKNWWYSGDENTAISIEPSMIPSNVARTYYAAAKLLPGRTLAGSLVITGTGKVGNKLGVTISNLYPRDATLNKYEWYRGTGSDREFLGYSDTYTVTAKDAGKEITVSVTASNCLGRLTSESITIESTNQLTTTASVQADSKAATKDEVTTEAEEAAETEATTTADAQSQSTKSSTDGTTNASDEASTDAHASSDLPSAVKEESSQDEAQQADNAKTVDKAA